MSVRNLIRNNILSLSPYKCARDDFEGKAEVYLDANENYNEFIKVKDINRYPDPHSKEVVEAVSRTFGYPAEQIIIGNGSDEIIDLLFRIFCNPGKDSALIFPPTYGAYKVFASINDVQIYESNLEEESFALNVEKAIADIDKYKPKLVFICSPNNPTGNAFSLEAIEKIAKHNQGLTVVDEAYGDFSTKASAYTLMQENERIVLLRTLSKAWGLAGARIGICVSSKEICSFLYNVKYPYNVPLLSQKAAVKALSNVEKVKENICVIVRDREKLKNQLEEMGIKVFPSDANFLLIRVKEAPLIYKKLLDCGVVVRLRSSEFGCHDCLRVTIGSSEENDKFLDALKRIINE